MSLDPQQIRAFAGSAPVARIVVAEVRGSAPREVGAAMLVGRTEASGTIGGGALEFGAVARAREALIAGRDRFDRLSLGPGMGQCCGGAVGLLTEVWTTDRLRGVAGTAHARQVPGFNTGMPLAVKRSLTTGCPNGARLQKGWFIEPVRPPARPVWIFGAGHVGRALASVLAPLPQVAVTLLDDAASRLPDRLPPGVCPVVNPRLADAVAGMPRDAHGFVMTYSHALDLEICHRALAQGVTHLGLIGSATKRARFRRRLAELGLSACQVDRMVCPIGDPGLGKHPQAIALGVAAQLLAEEVKTVMVSE